MSDDRNLAKRYKKSRKRSGESTTQESPAKRATPKRLRGVTPGKNGQTDIRYFMSPARQPPIPPDQSGVSPTSQNITFHTAATLPAGSSAEGQSVCRRLNMEIPESAAVVDDSASDITGTGTVSETSEEDEVSDNETDSKEPSSVVSIHRILLGSQSRPSRSTETLDAEESVIDDMIKEYNAKIRKKRTKTKKEEKHEEYTLETENSYKLAEELKPLLEGREEFATRTYMMISTHQSDLVRQSSTDPEEHRDSITHTVIFFYRKGEIYALTTKNAWHMVYDQSDFDFPRKIAARLCSTDGVVRIEARTFVGNDLMEKKTLKDEQSLSVTEEPVLCNTFTAHLRQDASLRKIRFFRQDKVPIKFGYTYLRILKRIPLSLFHLILDHFSLIANGYDTYKLSPNRTTNGAINTQVRNEDTTIIIPQPSAVSDAGPSSLLQSPPARAVQTLECDSQESVYDINDSQLQSSQESVMLEEGTDNNRETDTNAYERTLIKVNQEMYVKLETALAEHFLTALNLKVSPIRNFEIQYKHVDDFDWSSPSHLVVKNINDPLPLPSRPSVADVVNVLTENEDQYEQIRKMKATSRASTFYNKLRKGDLQIQYTGTNGALKTKNIRQFLEGEMMYKGQIFWRVNNLWFSLKPIYALTAHKWFAEFSGKNLLRDGDKGLTKKWPKRSIREGNFMDPDFDVVKLYLDQYRSTPRYYEAPSQSPNLFDLMHLHGLSGNLRLMFYLIVPNFYTCTTQVLSRIHGIHEALKRAVANKDGPLRDFYKFHHKKGTEDLSELDYDQFRELLKNCRIVCAIPKALPRGFITTGPIDHHLTHSEDRFDTASIRGKPSLVRESELKMSVTKAELQRILKARTCPLTHEEKTRLCNRDENEPEDVDLNKDVAAVIHTELKNYKYITSDDNITVKLLYSNERNFKTQKFNTGINNSMRKKVYGIVSQFKSHYNSLRAKLEIRYWSRQTVFNTSLVLEEIEEESEDEDVERNEETG